MPKSNVRHYEVLVRPCADERGRFRYVLAARDGNRIDSQASFGSERIAQAAGELAVRSLNGADRQRSEDAG